jgi:hypothetical protein
MIKALKKLGLEVVFHNIIRTTYDKLRANLILNGEQLSLFPLKSGTRLPIFSIPIQYSFGIPIQNNKIRARNKRDSNREGRSQTIPIYRYMILYL